VRLRLVSALRRGVTRGGKGVTIPLAPIHCGGTEKFQKCHKYFHQHSKFSSERAEVRTWECQTCFLPRAPSNLVAPLVLWHRDCVTWSDNSFHMISWTLLDVPTNTGTCFKTMYLLFISNFYKIYLSLLQKISWSLSQKGKLSSKIATFKVSAEGELVKTDLLGVLSPILLISLRLQDFE